MEASFSSSFKRIFKKRIKGNPDLESRFWQKLEQLKVAIAQPEISSALAQLVRNSQERIETRIPAWQRSIEEILWTWRLPE